MPAAIFLLAADQAPSGPAEPVPGEGVVCALAIYSAIAEVGRQCFPDNDPEFQDHLRKDVAKLDAYVLANSKLTPIDLENFKRSQALVGLPKAKVCTPDLMGLYRSAANKTPIIEIDKGIDKLIARPGVPTLGDCL